jgi:hypothetical protein
VAFKFNAGAVNKLRLNASALSSNDVRVICGEVLDVITNKDHPDYKGETTLGAMKIKPLSSGAGYSGDPESGNAWVTPLTRDLMTLPLKGEFVLAVKGVAIDTQNVPKSSVFYSIGTVSVYGEKNENSLPNASFNSNKWLNDELGDTFEEKETPQIHPFEGDTILQGRFDNGMRLGSTIIGAETPNTWSEGTDSGDPIMILTNEFADDSKIEDINKDKSTIMLTSTQKIDIELANKEAPQTVAVPTGAVVPMDPMNAYVKKPQVIISSDRLIFNAKKDNIIIAAKKDISLSTSKWKVNVTALADILLETLNQLTMEMHPTPAGPSGPPVNAAIYGMLKTQLESMKQ